MRPLPLLLLLLTAPVVLAAPPRVTASWSPERVVLGQDSRVTVEVHVPPGSGPVRGAASSGGFASDRVEGGAVRTFQWTPPSVRYPLVAVLAFWVDDGAQPPEVAVLRIPLLGKTQLEVSTAAGADVVVEVGGARFGPVRADARGRARVPVEVPPGVRVAQVLAARNTLNTHATIRLDPPNEAPLVAALTPSPLPAGTGGWLLVAGEPELRQDGLVLSVEGAKLSPEGGGPPSRYRVTPDADATTVAVTVRRRKGHQDKARAAADVSRDEASRVEASSVPGANPSALAPAASAWRPSVFLLAGGAFASGANTGPTGAVGISLVPPGRWERFAVEVEAGLRRATLDGRVEVLGAVRSRVLAVPVLASVRARLLRGSAFSLYGRAGGGVLPFQHVLGSDFQEDLKESKLAGMGFLSLQGAYRFGRWSALAEARGAWAPAHTPWLDAQLGGLSALLGVRFEP
ncbi:hypothetical protein [Myxococcus sp. RHSTA-1-4]|uniref:hypothetical protein n=1 Tax=Myxococcus sp. RHSTA-1-4 TaxID=2874601 RepID=UPI001CBDDFE8|nr:hypothetical protein [Myxococcus sp. RHSTA-1-4]